MAAENDMALEWSWAKDVPIGQNVSSLSVNYETGSLNTLRWIDIELGYLAEMAGDDVTDKPS